MREPAMEGRAPASPGIIRRRGAPPSNADRAEFGQSVPCVKAELSRAE
jgi:hypothetical protein